MVTVGRDPVAPPISARHMTDWVPNLTMQHIEESGHWVQQEEPQKLNQILLDWLQSLYINKDTLLRPKM
jgi:soluble epoxide hydrolase/lipid-phosphate phosphatase